MTHDRPASASGNDCLPPLLCGASFSALSLSWPCWLDASCWSRSYGWLVSEYERRGPPAHLGLSQGLFMFTVP
jgi:hypothetical protein